MDIFWIKDKSLADLDNLPTLKWQQISLKICKARWNVFENCKYAYRSREKYCKQIVSMGGNENDNRINASIAFKR